MIRRLPTSCMNVAVILYQQKKMLEDFLEHGAISQAQFDKSFGDLTEKMGMQEYENHID